MDTVDSGFYLTDKLRRLSPGSYDREIRRARVKSRRLGFVLGSCASLLGAAVLVFLFARTEPEVLVALILGLQ